MLNAVGPVIGNRLTDAHRVELKPHLRERLARLTSYSTPLGTVTTGADGRLSFAPKGDLLRGSNRTGSEGRSLSASAFRPGQRVRVHATLRQLLAQEIYPFSHDDAVAVMDAEGVVMEDAGCAALGLVVVSMPGEPWAFMPAFLQLLAPAEGDDEREAMTSGPAFDPYSEPLAVDDTVRGMDGCTGRVTLVEPQRLGVSFDCGSQWVGAASWRSSFRLLAKAAHMPTAAAAAWGDPKGCPF